MKKPLKNRPLVIGITLDYEEGGDNYSKMPYYALRENYCSSVSRHGTVPVPLTHELACVDSYAAMIDGLIITGGAFDVPPELYGESNIHEKVSLKDQRTRFEWGITQKMLDLKKPILGICGGQQLLNVVLGGTLIQHIPDTVPNALEHEQKNPRSEPGHDVAIIKGTLLHKVVGSDTMAVNSAHHQAVAELGNDCVVNARSSDGVIEGIEWPDHPFCLGVQWHPEYEVTPADQKIIVAFLEACRKQVSHSD
ncbi:MAG: gamma-glutamyl-gamma-aminobutyrate hydrolase family protein [Alphaproteobacteria bacterium]